MPEWLGNRPQSGTRLVRFQLRPRLSAVLLVPAARSTKDVRLPPKQTVASSSLAEPTPVFRCETHEKRQNAHATPDSSGTRNRARNSQRTWLR